MSYTAALLFHRRLPFSSELLCSTTGGYVFPLFSIDPVERDFDFTFDFTMPKSHPNRMRSRQNPGPVQSAASAGAPTMAPKRRGRPRKSTEAPVLPTTDAPTPPAVAPPAAALPAPTPPAVAPPALEVNRAFEGPVAMAAGRGEFVSRDEIGVSTIPGPAATSGAAIDYTRPVPIFSVTSSLGYHVPSSIKETIWSGAYVDLALLINDAAQGLVPHGENKPHLMLALDGDRVVLRPPGPGRKRIDLFDKWQSVFHTFMTIYLSKHVSRFAELLKYCEFVRTAAVQFSGFGWRVYDEQFRLKQEIMPSRSWAEIDMELWVTVTGVSLSSPAVSQSTSMFPSRPKRFGLCFAFNGSQGCNFGGCKYVHACKTCSRPGHGAFRCTVAPVHRNRQQSGRRLAPNTSGSPTQTTPVSVTHSGKGHSFRHPNAN